MHKQDKRKTQERINTTMMPSRAVCLSGFLRVKRFSAGIILLLFSVFLNTSCLAANSSDSAATSQQRKENSTMKIRFVFDDQTVNATLEDSSSTRDFIAQLPLTFELKDYASTEKIAYLPKKLSTEGQPSGTSAKAGDISYYAPWGNMVVFYKNFGHASGLIRLGHLDGGLERFTAKNKSLEVTIELAE